MRYFLVLTFTVMAFGCTNSADPTSQANSATTSNANNAGPLRTGKATSTIEHTTEKPSATPSNSNTNSGRTSWTRDGNPIDTSEFDSAIAAADKALKSKPNDQTAKNNAAEAYFKRGFALTEARQYASALGDYRRALKIVPTHAESITWEKQIIDIYDMIKKDYPKPGEEPQPLPFKKQ